MGQITAGLDVHIDQAENSRSAYRMAHQLGSADSGLEPSREARNIIQRDHVLESLAAIILIYDETSLAVTSWLGFTQTAILDWIDNPVISRQQLHDLGIRTLRAAVRLPN